MSLISRSLACLAILLLLGVPALAAQPGHEGDPETDWCSRRNDNCQASCSRYNFTLWGQEFPSPRTAACHIECTVAYVGCIMFRFHSGN